MTASAQPSSPPMVVSALGKRFGERTVLDDVDFELRAGELVAIVGPNGAGKTTLLSIMAGVETPSTGEATAVGKVGWVPQQPALYAKLSVRENLRLFARLERSPDPDAVVARMLEQTQLAGRAGDEVGRLSGGNQQRVNIAIGLLCEPAVLLLDEPSSSLDPGQRERLWEFVAGLAAAGTTVAYSSHNVVEAERHADRVLVLAEGRLLFSGTPQELWDTAPAAPGGERPADFEAAFVGFLRERGH